MNVDISGIEGGIFILWALFCLFVLIFYMVCAWRAMRAHEHIAQAMIEYVRRKD